MENTDKFNVKYLDDAWDFLLCLDDKTRRKLLSNIEIARKCNNPKYFKKLDSTDLWEFRARIAKLQYRLLAFWDTRHRSLVIATHGFIKKSQKTPLKEVIKAEKLRIEYFSNSNNK